MARGFVELHKPLCPDKAVIREGTEGCWVVNLLGGVEYTLQKLCGYKDELVSSVSLCCLYLILASRT